MDRDGDARVDDEGRMDADSSVMVVGKAGLQVRDKRGGCFFWRRMEEIDRERLLVLVLHACIPLLSSV